MNNQFVKGMRHGIPILLGYLSVSFGFGILAVDNGISPLAATVISGTNLTSAGQTSAVITIGAGGTMLSVVLQLIITQFIINLRYSLMAISLSQKLHPSFTTPHRLMAGFGITDEIFAVAYAQPTPVTPSYMYGLMAVSWVGWVTGTLLGAVAGQLLPEAVSEAMGILLYGMFIAIVVPPARKEKRVLFVVLAAASFSVLFHFVLPAVPASLAVVISAVVAAALGAWWFPLRNEEDAV
ncbi:MAG: AzlC family ABC transporter permease [Clostridia bacterium]|nr:AzlC family ABC transporter permease [Clostridia bacterium]